MPRADAASRHRRLGLIIKTIANRPGITLQGLLLALRDHGCAASERTLAKDILLLKSEFNLLPSRERLRGGYVLTDVFTIADSEFTLLRDAVFAFAVNLQDDQFEDMMDRMLSRINSLSTTILSLPPTTRLVGQRVITKGSKKQSSNDVILMESISTGVAVSLEYRSPRISTPAKFSVYLLFKVFYQRAWYVIAKDLKTRRYYPCRLDRIESVKVIKSHPKNEDLITDAHTARYLMNCGWGMTFPESIEESNEINKTQMYVVRFDASVSAYILETESRHPRAEILHAKDGTGDVLMRIRLNDPWEFKHWVRSFGASAWFESPPSACDEERNEVRRMAERYGFSCIEKKKTPVH